MKYLHYMATSSQRVAALDRVLELAVLVDADMTRTLAERGLTTARTHLLWVLHHRGPSTQRDLAAALDVSARNVTGLVDALEETGFVRREAHPTDRRAVLVHLTAAGEATTSRMVAEQADFADRLFRGLPRATFEGFVTGLDAVLDRLRPLVEEAGRG